MFLETLRQKHLAVKACLYKRCTVSYKVTLILPFMQVSNLNVSINRTVGIHNSLE
jgi:hypothetical protein